MSNAVANRYRRYGPGSAKFGSISQKYSAIHALNQERSRLQLKLDDYRGRRNGYQNNVLPNLTKVTSNFEGFILNKVKNAKNSLNQGYVGNKLDKFNMELTQYMNNLTSFSNNVGELRVEVTRRVNELNVLIGDLESQLADVNNVASRVSRTPYIPED